MKSQFEKDVNELADGFFKFGCGCTVITFIILFLLMLIF
jgi:hypothetical protein